MRMFFHPKKRACAKVIQSAQEHFKAAQLLQESEIRIWHQLRAEQSAQQTLQDTVISRYFFAALSKQIPKGKRASYALMPQDNYRPLSEQTAKLFQCLNAQYDIYLRTQTDFPSANTTAQAHFEDLEDYEMTFEIGMRTPETNPLIYTLSDSPASIIENVHKHLIVAANHIAPKTNKARQIWEQDKRENLNAALNHLAYTQITAEFLFKLHYHENQSGKRTNRSIFRNASLLAHRDETMSEVHKFLSTALKACNYKNQNQIEKWCEDHVPKGSKFRLSSLQHMNANLAQSPDI